jgi:processing peptidase subunit alpha
MNLESRVILFEDIGRQILTYGERESAESICHKIDNVTVEDIMRVGQRAVKSGAS